MVGNSNRHSKFANEGTNEICGKRNMVISIAKTKLFSIENLDVFGVFHFLWLREKYYNPPTGEKT